jgi:hypothetical protein
MNIKKKFFISILDNIINKTIPKKDTKNKNKLFPNIIFDNLKKTPPPV